MKRLLIGCFMLLLFSCKTVVHLSTPQREINAVDGSVFYKQAAAMNWKQRDSFALEQILSGNMPSFLKKFAPVHLSVTDSSTNKTIKAIIYVSPDYLSIGYDEDPLLSGGQGFR